MIRSKQLKLPSLAAEFETEFETASEFEYSATAGILDAETPVCGVASSALLGRWVGLPLIRLLFGSSKAFAPLGLTFCPMLGEVGHNTSWSWPIGPCPTFLVLLGLSSVCDSYRSVHTGH